MPNVSRISGFKVVGSLNGGSATGQANLYYVASAADEILVGDIVRLSGSSDANGRPGCDLVTTPASQVPVGVVVGIINGKLDPGGLMTTGSITLDLPAVAQIAAGASGYVLVNDDPDIVLEAEASNGTPLVTDVGLNIAHAIGTRDATTRTSPAYLDFGTELGTSTLPFQLLGFVQRADNEVGASAKMKVRFNVHQYKTVGTTGI